jgi:anti-sigma regulatory factor (Ser/Thr protein kinase)
LELSFANQASEIPRVHQALDEFAARNGLSDRSLVHSHLALEEYLTNIVSHGYAAGETGRIVVRFGLEASVLRIEIEDDGRPFNLNEAPEVDTSVPLEEKPIGGLGIHMIRKSVDGLDYQRAGGRNLLVMTKRLS